MYYFVNEYLLTLNSGIEHTELKRLAMFASQGIAAKLVTRDYDQLVAKNRDRFDLKPEQFVNMYDFFQGIVTLPRQAQNHPTIADLHLAADYNIDPGADVSHVYAGDQLIAAVYFAPGTIGQLSRVEYFDRAGQKVMASLWDWRGFKARDQFFNGTELANQITYDPQGQRVIEEYFGHDSQGDNVLTLLQLPNYQAQTLFFNDYDSLFTFFLDELNRHDGGHSTFIADRPGTAYQAVLNMQSSAHKFVSLPTTHTVDVNDQVFANLSSLYVEPLVNKITRLEGIIVATAAQKADLTRWMGGANKLKAPIYALPYGTVPEVAHDYSLSSRQRHQVLAVSRLTTERHNDQIIAAFQTVLATVPDATLVIYGYGDQQAALQQQIELAHLEDSVTLKGYVPDLATVYAQAAVYVNASESDSEPLALSEALNADLPVIAYQIHYGTSELIQPNGAGFLLPFGDLKAMAAKMITLLTDDQVWQRCSQAAGAVILPREFGPVFKQWQAALSIQETDKNEH